VAVNLAAAMANSGRKVLLVDANFRRPAVRGLFSISREVGLSDVLTGQAQWRDAAAETQVDNLTVLSSGSQVPPNPAELLGSDLAKTTLSEMQAEYDQVIFDGPPLLLVSDGPVLASLVDGVVMVVRAGENSSGIVSRCRGTLSRVGAHVLGVVLNGVRATAGGYLRKNYDTFYDYHELQ
jgi:capsular exopolysaccharide synthesis family protein